jgi:archaellum component FlaC
MENQSTPIDSSCLQQMTELLGELDRRIKKIQQRRKELEDQLHKVDETPPQSSNSLAEELAKAALRQGWSRDDVRKAFGV